MLNKLLIRIAVISAALFGSALILYVVVPMVKYQITARAKFYTYVSPMPKKPVLFTQSGSKDKDVDYTNANNWFEGVSLNNQKQSGIEYYTISIPSLGISNATVSIGGEDLSESLIQYPGTAEPGMPGNSVIFGHSILPQFFNPKDYLAIFSTLPTMEEGDLINVNHDGISYKYEVEEMFEVRPTDVYILDQTDKEPYLSLVTCTPPGHPLRPKRLVVRAKIVPPDNLSLRSQ